MCIYSEAGEKLLFGKLRKHIGEVLHDLANRKESAIVEGHWMLDHIHMCINSRPCKIHLTVAVALYTSKLRQYMVVLRGSG